MRGPHVRFGATALIIIITKVNLSANTNNYQGVPYTTEDRIKITIN